MAGNAFLSIPALEAPGKSSSGNMRDLVRFEEDLVAFLSKFTEALEAESRSLSSRLDSLAADVGRSEEAMGRIDRRLESLQAAGLVRVLPLDAIQIPGAIPGTSGIEANAIANTAAISARDERLYRTNGRDLTAKKSTDPLGWEPGRLGDVGISAADLDAINLGLRNMKARYTPSPPASFKDDHSRETSGEPNQLPPLAVPHTEPQGRSLPDNGYGEEDEIWDEERWLYEGASSIASGSLQGLQGHGLRNDLSHGSLRNTFTMDDEDDPERTGGPGGSQEYRPSPEASQAAQRSHETLPSPWGSTGSLHKLPGSFAGEGMEPLEPSASAVRGFRALLEAALRAPGAMESNAWGIKDGGEDEQLSKHEPDGSQGANNSVRD